MKKTISLSTPHCYHTYFQAVTRFLITLLLLDWVHANGNHQAENCADVTSPILFLRSGDKQLCQATLYEKDRSNWDFSYWITAAECCDKGPIYLDNHGDKIAFHVAHSGPFLCIGRTLKVPIDGFDHSETTSFPPQSTFGIGTIRGTFKHVQNTHWFDTGKDLFSLSDISSKEKAGAAVFYDGKLVGVRTREFLKDYYFATVNDDSLSTKVLPKSIHISYASGFNSTFQNYQEHPTGYKASHYFFNNSIGTQVYYYNYEKFDNRTETIGLSREVFADNRTVDRLNVIIEGGCHKSEKHTSFYPDGSTNWRRLNHIYCNNGTETYTFQHTSPILKLTAPGGSCEAFKIDDPETNYQGRTHFLTAAHCVSPKDQGLYLTSDAHRKLNATLFSSNYFESDWAILVTEPTDGPGFRLLADQQRLPHGTRITHQRRGAISIGLQIGESGIDPSEALMGFKGLHALPGSSGSPILVNGAVFAIQSWTFDDVSMLASAIPPVSAFKKMIERRWAPLDRPIDKFAYFDNGGILNLTGFSIQDSVRSAQFRTYFDGQTTLFSKNWKRFGYTRQIADEHTITGPDTYQRYLKFDSWQNQTLTQASHYFSRTSTSNITCHDYVLTDKWYNCSRHLTKLSDSTIYENRQYSLNKFSNTLTVGFALEKSANNDYHYFKNLVWNGDNLKSWEASSEDEFYAGI